VILQAQLARPGISLAALALNYGFAATGSTNEMDSRADKLLDEVSAQAKFLTTFDGPLAPDERRQRLCGSVAAETEQKIAALIR